jgi:hypothetical protein
LHFRDASISFYLISYLTTINYLSVISLNYFLICRRTA